MSQNKVPRASSSISVNFFKSKVTGKGKDTFKIALGQMCGNYIIGIYHGYTLADHYDTDRRATRVRRVCKPQTDETYGNGKELIRGVIGELKGFIATFPEMADERPENAVMSILGTIMKCTSRTTRKYAK